MKQIYEVLLNLSPHNRELFEREMSIASKCRHPCLLQFIGATNDEGSPLFVTELMESSLRKLLEQRSLSTTEVAIISLDVARALNYLHQKKPRPIIHRDISSANVLLWRQADQWRGKVSDYGAANIMQHTMSVCPGAAVYSAPEAFTKNQTVKVCCATHVALWYPYEISAAPMCFYGNKLTNGEAKCRIMVLLILCGIPCQFVQVQQYTVLLKHLLKIKQ